MNNVKVIIPARLGSTRFPGKVLVDIGGKSLLQRCYESARLYVDHDDITVATSDNAVMKVTTDLGIRCVLDTSGQEFRNGSERVAWAADFMHYDPETIIVNMQCDQFGYHSPEFMAGPIEIVRKELADVATIAHPLDQLAPYQYGSRNTVVAWVKESGYALTFTRYLAYSPMGRPVTELKDEGAAEEDGANVQHKRVNGYVHVGVYVARKKDFDRYVTLPQTYGELSEGLEQLRWPQVLKVYIISEAPIQVDTEHDMPRAQGRAQVIDRRGMKEQQMFEDYRKHHVGACGDCPDTNDLNTRFATGGVVKTMPELIEPGSSFPRPYKG